MPWFFRHWINAVRLVFPLAEDAEFAPVAELVLVELLPQAASARLAMAAASAGIRRRARQWVLLGDCIWILSCLWG
jgi:hypothetical protein